MYLLLKIFVVHCCRFQMIDCRIHFLEKEKYFFKRKHREIEPEYESQPWSWPCDISGLDPSFSTIGAKSVFWTKLRQKYGARIDRSSLEFFRLIGIL